MRGHLHGIVVATKKLDLDWKLFDVQHKNTSLKYCSYEYVPLIFAHALGNSNITLIIMFSNYHE